MSILGAKIQAGFEPIPGYVLTKKLGSGGYGDVWSADAPGGLKKAIKFVYGTIHEDRASAELKSLQRVRQVNHPFILSLERIEIVEGQLLIVTELAQGSLYDRFIEFREKGFAGIAHDRLLSYLRDAADGLDFLCQKHELQHLDVKPGNLLLVSDRIKVADFGLVKDLHSMSQSLLGGLTPTYAAPEMFDGRPGRYSDQYSLAIVYQEMLTGTLPFRGRTTAQLANEHLNKAPNLDDLPIEERPIIAKALAKRPQQRFADCKEMILALEHATAISQEASNEKVRVRGWSPKISPAKPWVQRMNPRAGKESPLLSRARRTSDSTSPNSESNTETRTAITTRTFVVGVGGTGAEVVAEMRRRYDTLGGKDIEQPRYFVLDSDSSSLRFLSDRTCSWALDRQSVFHAPLKSPHYYRDESSPFPQLSRRWLYNIPRSQLTEGVRPLGMLAFIDHAPQIFEMLGLLLEDFSSSEEPAQPMSIRIVASAMGGTGSAAMSELGFLIRQICSVLQIPIQSELVLTCAAPSPSALGDLASASAIASFLEVQHYFRTNGLHPSLPKIPDDHGNTPPFDTVKLIYGGQCGSRTDRYDGIKQVTDYLMLSAPLPPPRPHADGENQAAETSANDTSKWLSTIRICPFPLETNIQPSKASTTVFLKSLVGWISALDSAVASGASTQKLLVPPKAIERLEFLVTDTFRVCNWNAQAWVRDVMRAILPDDQTVMADFRSKTQPSACSLEYLDDLKRVCDPLGVDLSESSISIQQLFECRHEKLLELLCSWVSNIQNWPLFPKLLDLIEERIKVNSHSLFSVAKKLDERYAKVVEEEIKLNGDVDSSSSPQLSKVEIEAVFHKLSGKMLLNFVDRLKNIRTIWQKCSRELHGSLSAFGNNLAHSKFNCTLDEFVEQNPQLKVDLLNRLCLSALTDLVQRDWIDQFNIRELFPSKGDGQIGDEKYLRGKSIDEQLELIHDRIQKEFAQHSNPIAETVNREKVPSDSSQPIEPTIGLSIAAPTKTMLRADLNMQMGSSGRTVGFAVREASETANAGKDPFDLESKIDACLPYLADFGESIRLFLYISDMVWFQLPETLQSQIEQTCQVQLLSEKTPTYLVAEGIDLDIEELIDKVWMPTNETWQLVPRVLSRVDIEWLPFQPTEQ